MNFLVTAMLIGTLASIATSVINLIITLKSKSYLNYRKQLRHFEMKKNKIEEELENDREKF